MARLRLWIGSLLGRHRFERDLSDEVAFHLERRAEHWCRQGLDRTQAHRRARLEFGNVERVKQEVRDTRFGAWFETARQDFHHARRSLAANPGVTAIVVISLAVGIGSHTTMFSIVDAMILRPLPYTEPERLVRIVPVRVADQARVPDVTVREFLRSRAPDLLDGAEFTAWFVVASITGDTSVAEQLRGQKVSTGLFALIGVDPVLGRHFRPEESLAGGDKVVILSHRTWLRWFDGDRGSLGATLRIDNVSHTLVGVMPPGFDFGRDGLNQFWLPAELPRAESPTRAVVGRLAGGVTIERARAVLAALSFGGDEGPVAGALESGGGPGATWRLELESLHESSIGEIKRSLQVLWGATALLLFVATANAAGLLLARATSRSRDVALRMAVGARRWRVIRLFLAEGALFGLTGGLLGTLVAVAGVRLVQIMRPDTNPLNPSPAMFPRLDTATVDLRALSVALLVSLAMSTLISLAVALRVTALDLDRSLKQPSAGGAWARTGGVRIGGALVITQAALAIVLLAAAGLMVRSMLNTWRVDPGLDPERVLTLRTKLVVDRYWEVPTAPGARPSTLSPRVDLFYQQVLDRLSRLPGVQAAGGAGYLPMGHYRQGRSFVITGRPLPDNAPRHGGAVYTPVVGDYFEVMGIDLLRGRTTDASDTAASPWVVLVNQTAAQEYWPAGDPVGRYVTMIGRAGRPANGEREREIIGIVADVSDWSLQAEPNPMMYVPAAQQPMEAYAEGRDAGLPQRRLEMAFVLKTAGPPERWAALAQNVVAEVDRDQPVHHTAPMDAVVGIWTSGPSFYTALALTLAVVAVGLAAIGLYGILAYTVGLRTHEIGVRMALGAGQAGVVSLVAKQALALCSLGVAIGLVGAYWLNRFVASLQLDSWGGDATLFGVSSSDPVTMFAVTVVMLGVATLASYRPARRASRVDPMIALRAE